MMQDMPTLALPKDIRLRLKFHIGGSIEARYQLVSYGIPVDTIPLTKTGTVKTKQLHQQYIDIPMTKNVVFRNGTSAMCHPGDAKFRELIATHYHDHCRAATSQEKAEVS